MFAFKKSNNYYARIYLILSMVIFGTIGIFRRHIPLPSGALAMLRGLVGAAALLIIMFIIKKPPKIKNIKSNLFLLIISGALIGFNWIFLFEAYNYTTVATATLCYYMAPVFVLIASPIFLKEKLSLKQIVCAATAIIGIVLVSGVFNQNTTSYKNEFLGILLGLAAALLYATVIILNKKITKINSLDKTVFQLSSAGIVILPYSLFFEDFNAVKFDTKLILLIIIVCLIHTALAYLMYFSAIKNIKATTAAIFSYIDPIVAILLSAIILNEKLNFYTILGSILILGSTFFNEIEFKKVR